jgi:NAD(P)-dependent dehydrogenase (short-subunit alcohol dehydrogenase family)
VIEDGEETARLCAATGNDASFFKCDVSDEDSVAMASAAVTSALGTPFRYPSSCNWNTEQSDLKEDLAHLVQDIKRRICGIASAGSPSFSI